MPASLTSSEVTFPNQTTLEGHDRSLRLLNSIFGGDLGEGKVKGECATDVARGLQRKRQHTGLQSSPSLPPTEEILTHSYPFFFPASHRGRPDCALQDTIPTPRCPEPSEGEAFTEPYQDNPRSGYAVIKTELSLQKKEQATVFGKEPTT